MLCDAHFLPSPLVRNQWQIFICVVQAERQALQVKLGDAQSALEAANKATAESAARIAALEEAQAEREKEMEEAAKTQAELMNMFAAAQARLTKK